MAVSVGVFIQIFLMPLLRLEEVPQRLQFHRQWLAKARLDGRERILQNRAVGRIGIVDAGAIARALVMPLAVQAQGVDDAEIEIRQRRKADALGAVAHADGLRKAGGVGVDLLVRGAPVELRRALGIAADGAHYAVDPGEEMLRAPKASACEIYLFSCHSTVS